MRALNKLLIGTTFAALAAGCSSNDAEVHTRGQALTEEQNRVLGFEAPTQDWSTSNGSVVGSSGTVTEGSSSLAVEPNGYTEIVSTQIPAPGSAVETATVDLQLPQAISWGDARLVVQVPSEGQNWRDLGGTALGSLSAGEFHTLSFDVPSDVRAALESDAEDVSFRVILNVPSGSGTYLLDNLVVSDDGASSGDDELATTGIEFSITVPAGVPIAETMISANNRVTIDDRSTLAEEGAQSSVANLGPNKLEFGAGINAYVDVYSVGDIDFLRSQSHVYGGITTAGEILQQDNVVVDGGIEEGIAITPATTTWTVDWPADVTRDIARAPDTATLRVEPGAWDSIQVSSRAGVLFSSGTYYINSLVVEPEATIAIDARNGPVILYVSDTLRLRSSLGYLGGNFGQVLFGYLGQQAALFEEALVATVIAPNSAIELRRPNSGLSHQGSFFGKEVHVFSDSVVEHLPLDWSFICPSGDYDEDSVLDCYDECWADPEKTDPGICGCGTSDVDTDADGLPDCLDNCPLDAEVTTRGMCRCPSDPDVAPAGTPCNDGVVPGTFTCNGQGVCGGDEASLATIIPEAGCTLKTVGHTGYWFCPSRSGGQDDADGAAARCANSPRGRLARIDDRQKNALIASWVDGPSWIAAFGFASSGDWLWPRQSGLDWTQFWTGGATGHAVEGRFTAWSRGEPETSGASARATISADELWRTEDPHTSLPYVCEFPFASDLLVGTGYFFDKPKGPAEIIPGWLPADADGFPEGYPVLTPPDDSECEEPTLLAGSEDAYREEGQAAADLCNLHCGPDSEIEDESLCDSYCGGSFSVPPADAAECTGGLHRLDQVDILDPGTCEVLDLADLPADLTEDEQLAELRAAQDCSGHITPFTTPGLSMTVDVPSRCGVQTVCFALDSAGEPKSCTVGTECSSGICECIDGGDCEGEDKFCIDPNLANACQSEVTPTGSSTEGPAVDRLDADGMCAGQCFSRVGCGISERDGLRAAIENTGVNIDWSQILPELYPVESFDRCEEVTLCGPEYDGDVITSNIEEGEPYTGESLPSEEDVVPDYPNDFDDPCAGRLAGCSAICLSSTEAEKTECERWAHRHPWCTNDVTNRVASTASETDDEAEGRRGDEGAPVSFRMNPISDLQFAVDPLPYGAAKFNAHAAAGVTAAVDFDVLGTAGSVELVDLRADITASLCRAATADSRLEVVGVDFLPEIASSAIFDSDEVIAKVDGKVFSERCEEAVDRYVDAFDRAKKAMRDAQELITQYEDRASRGLTFEADFCETVAGAGMRPPEMGGACPETPEQVIQRFIDYYKHQAASELLIAVEDLKSSVLSGKDLKAAIEAAVNAANGNNEFSLPKQGDYAFFAELGMGEEESVTLVSLQFFIGPIPCLLEVSSYVDYGIKGGFGLEVKPRTLIGQRGDFAMVGAEVGPYANSGITLFVGVGFNLGILKLALGVEGGVTLGHVSLPAVVSAGLNVSRTEEKTEGRPIPSDLDGLYKSVSGEPELLFPPSGLRQGYSYQFRYKYGVGLEVSDILTGYLSGSLEVTFLFFSKKFSQRIATFKPLIEGIGPLMLVSGEGGVELGSDGISAEGDYGGVVADGEAFWKRSFESVPFVEFESVQWPGGDVLGTEAFDPGKSVALFYDELCEDCSESGAACTRDADCCADGESCLGTEGNKTCGVPACLPTDTACTSDDECCDGDRCLYQSTGRVCSQRRCEVKKGGGCLDNDAYGYICCTGGLVCQQRQGKILGTCIDMVK